MAYMVADMEVDLVANMEVDKVADMAYDITPACHISGRHGGQEDKWPTLRWTWRAPMSGLPSEFPTPTPAL